MLLPPPHSPRTRPAAAHTSVSAPATISYVALAPAALRASLRKRCPEKAWCEEARQAAILCHTPSAGEDGRGWTRAARQCTRHTGHGRCPAAAGAPFPTQRCGGGGDLGAVPRRAPGGRRRRACRRIAWCRAALRRAMVLGHVLGSRRAARRRLTAARCSRCARRTARGELGPGFRIGWWLEASVAESLA